MLSKNQCYKYRVGEYIAEGPKRNYQIYRRKCRQTSAIYRQNKKFENIKKYKKEKNHNIFEKIGKYRDKIGKYRDIFEKIGKYHDKIGKTSKIGENIEAIYFRHIANELTLRYITMLPIYRRCL